MTSTSTSSSSSSFSPSSPISQTPFSSSQSSSSSFSSLPRPLILWLQSLDLSFSLRHFRRDFSNGFLVAEMFSRYFPEDFSLHSFHNGNNMEIKLNNWSFIQNKMKKKNFPPILTDDSIRKVSAAVNNDEITKILKKIYEILTGKTLPKTPKQFDTKRENSSLEMENATSPSFLRPTASMVIKESLRIFPKISDENLISEMGKTLLFQHYEEEKERRERDNFLSKERYKVIKPQGNTRMMEKKHTGRKGNKAKISGLRNTNVRTGNRNIRHGTMKKKSNGTVQSSNEHFDSDRSPSDHSESDDSPAHSPIFGQNDPTAPHPLNFSFSNPIHSVSDRYSPSPPTVFSLLNASLLSFCNQWDSMTETQKPSSSPSSSSFFSSSPSPSPDPIVKLFTNIDNGPKEFLSKFLETLCDAFDAQSQSQSQSHLFHSLASSMAFSPKEFYLFFSLFFQLGMECIGNSKSEGTMEALSRYILHQAISMMTNIIGFLQIQNPFYTQQLFSDFVLPKLVSTFSSNPHSIEHFSPLIFAFLHISQSKTFFFQLKSNFNSLCLMKILMEFIPKNGWGGEGKEEEKREKEFYEFCEEIIKDKIGKYQQHQQQQQHEDIPSHLTAEVVLSLRLSTSLLSFPWLSRENSFTQIIISTVLPMVINITNVKTQRKSDWRLLSSVIDFLSLCLQWIAEGGQWGECPISAQQVLTLIPTLLPPSSSSTLFHAAFLSLLPLVDSFPNIRQFILETLETRDDIVGEMVSDRDKDSDGGGKEVETFPFPFPDRWFFPPLHEVISPFLLWKIIVNHIHIRENSKTMPIPFLSLIYYEIHQYQMELQEDEERSGEEESLLSFSSDISALLLSSKDHFVSSLRDKNTCEITKEILVSILHIHIHMQSNGRDSSSIPKALSALFHPETDTHTDNDDHKIISTDKNPHVHSSSSPLFTLFLHVFCVDHAVPHDSDNDSDPQSNLLTMLEEMIQCELQLSSDPERGHGSVPWKCIQFIWNVLCELERREKDILAQNVMLNQFQRRVKLLVRN